MDKQRLLRALLALSRAHHRLTIEERWEPWEAVAGRKEALYRRIHANCATAWNGEARQVLADIASLEEQTRSELDRKRIDARDRLLRVNRTRRALKGYAKPESTRPGGRFGIRC